jgi:hypothetical protein
MIQSADPAPDTLDAHPEAAVRDGAGAPQVEVVEAWPPPMISQPSGASMSTHSATSARSVSGFM